MSLTLQASACVRPNLFIPWSQVWSDAVGWQRVYGCSVAPMLTSDVDVSKRDCHGWLFGWRDGTVFQARMPLASVHTRACRNTTDSKLRFARDHRH